MHLNLRSPAGEHELDVATREGGWTVTLDGVTHDVAARPDGRGGWLVTWEGRRRPVHVAAVGDARHVAVDGRVTVLHLHDPDREDAAGADAAGGPALVATMPGKVVSVLVEEGAAVHAGQPVLILESMKMETELASAVDGTVARVHVAAGDQVAQGDALLDVVADGEPAE